MAASAHGDEYLAESKATLLNVFYAIPIPLELASTLFRIWIKADPKKPSHMAFDDYLMIWATAVAIGVCICGLVWGAPYGLGRHLAAVSEDDVHHLLKGDYIFSHFYNMAIATTKLSVLALYYRIFAKPVFRAIVLGTIIFICVWLIVMEVTLGFGCRPIRGWWDAVEATCVNKVAFTYFTNITNLVADVWIFSLPIPILLSLQMQNNRRISLLFLFSLGLATCAISGARLQFVVGVSSDDFTWTSASLGILSAWEPCGGILCANLPVVYRAMLGIVRNVSSSVGFSKNCKGDTANSGRPSNVTFNNDWARIHSNPAYRHGIKTISEVSANKPDFRDHELGGIRVERSFHAE